MEDEEQGPMGATESVIQAQDPALLSSSPPRKLYFLPPKDNKLYKVFVLGKRDPDPQSASHYHQTC